MATLLSSIGLNTTAANALLIIGLCTAYTSPLLAVNCQDLAADARRDNLQRVHDNFDTTTEIAEFWDIHPRFGFVRDGDRIVLVARSEEILNTVLRDFKKIGFEGAIARSEFAKVQDGVAADVSAALPAVLARLHGRALASDGANCWHHCLLDLVTKGSLPMSAAEFRHWLESPLAREVQPQEAMAQGDVIVFRNTNAPPQAPERNEVHGALYLSENLALAKSAQGRYYPYRILDRREAVGFYYPSRSETVQAFRLQSIVTAVRDLKAPTADRLRTLVDEVLALERESESLFYRYSPTGKKLTVAERFELINRFEQLAARLQTEAKEAINRLEQAGATSAHSLELALWQGLQYKANTYNQLDVIVD